MQTIDTVVRSDVGVRPAWLCRKPGAPLRACGTVCSADFDVTGHAHEAYAFVSAADADTAAWLWSDVPGVWRVVVRLRRGIDRKAGQLTALAGYYGNTKL